MRTLFQNNSLRKLVASPYFWAFLTALCVSSFLIGKGIWLVQDNVYNAKTPAEAVLHLWRFFSATSLADNFQSSFGYDASLFNVSRVSYALFLVLIIVFRSAAVAQYLFLFAFLFVAFVVNYKFLFIISRSKLGSLLGAGFFCGAQYIFFFFTLPGFPYCVIAFQIVFLGVHGIMRNKERLHLGYVLLSVAGAYALISYSRTLIISLAMLIIVGLFYVNDLWKAKKRLFQALPLIALMTLPIIVAYVSKFFGSEYVKSFGIYQVQYRSSYGAASYMYHQTKNFFDALVFESPYHTFSTVTQDWYRNAYLAVSIVLGLVVILTLIRAGVSKKLKILLLVAFIGSFAIIDSAFFISESHFIRLTYEIAPFLANETAHLKIVLLVISCVAISLLPALLTKQFLKVGFAIFVVGFTLFTVSPIWWNGVKTEKFELSDIPEEYRTTFYQGGDMESMLVFPTAKAKAEDPFGLYFEWSPYPFELHQNTAYVPVLSSNPRFVNERESTLYDSFFSVGPTRNTSYLNLQNVFVLKDVRNTDGAKFDYYYNELDLVSESKRYYDLMMQSEAFELVEENDHFAHFKTIARFDENYQLYAPQSVVKTTPEGLVAEYTQGFTSPLFIDDNNFNHEALTVADFYSPSIRNTDTKLTFKSPRKNRNAYAVQIEKSDLETPFVITLSQAFWPTWKVFTISKEEYEKTKCDSTTEAFLVTNNAFCFIRERMFPLSLGKYLFEKEVPNTQHFEGNILANSWVLDPKSLSFSDNKAYIVLINMNQVYFTLSIFVGAVSVLVVAALALFKRNKHHL